MTFLQIKYFVEVANALSFTQAADKLFTSQQNISKQICSLEREIGVHLFSRTTRKILLTQSGEILYNEWKMMVRNTEEALRKAVEVNNKEKRKIRIGVVEMSEVIDFISFAVMKHNEQWPEIELEYEICSFKKLQEMLQKREIDIIITVSLELEKFLSIFETCFILELQLGIILSKKHPLSQRKHLHIKDLQQETFFIFSKSYSDDAEGRILAHCKKEGFTPKNIKYFNDINSMELALSSGKGIVVTYSMFFRNKDNQLKVYPIPIKEENICPSIVAAWRKEEGKDFKNLIDCMVQNKSFKGK